MRSNLTEIIAVLDRSGSMEAPQGNAAEVIKQFNNFVEEQKSVEGEANLTLVLFDSEYDVVHNGLNLTDVPELTSETYFPRGMTRLADALGKTINDVGDRLNKTPEEHRPAKVVLVCITDGGENASREFTMEQVKNMVKHQEEKYGWQFNFFGADIDSYQVSENFGINTANVANYGKGAVGTQSLFSNYSQTVRSYRAGGQSATSLSAEAKKDIEKHAGGVS